MRDRERIQRQQHTSETSSSFETQPQLDKAVQRGGQPLDAATRNFLEPKFGHSFENVQIHADGEADMLSQDFGARAFTTGPNIFFRAGEFDPSSNDGLHLLAHELTHTVQQRLTSNRLDRAVSSKSDGAEGEARAAADAVMGGQAVNVAPSATAAISREEGEEYNQSPANPKYSVSFPGDSDLDIDGWNAYRNSERLKAMDKPLEKDMADNVMEGLIAGGATGLLKGGLVAGAMEEARSSALESAFINKGSPIRPEAANYGDGGASTAPGEYPAEYNGASGASGGGTSREQRAAFQQIPTIDVNDLPNEEPDQ